jgi:hypothetical protein
MWLEPDIMNFASVYAQATVCSEAPSDESMQTPSRNENFSLKRFDLLPNYTNYLHAALIFNGFFVASINSDKPGVSEGQEKIFLWGKFLEGRRMIAGICISSWSSDRGEFIAKKRPVTYTDPHLEESIAASAILTGFDKTSSMAMRVGDTEQYMIIQNIFMFPKAGKKGRWCRIGETTANNECIDIRIKATRWDPGRIIYIKYF